MEAGVALSYAVMYGALCAGKTPVPLWLAMAPTSALLRAVAPAPVRAHAPVSVRNVAAAEVNAALEVALCGDFRVVDNEALLRCTPTDA